MNQLTGVMSSSDLFQNIVPITAKIALGFVKDAVRICCANTRAGSAENVLLATALERSVFQVKGAATNSVIT